MDQQFETLTFNRNQHSQAWNPHIQKFNPMTQKWNPMTKQWNPMTEKKNPMTRDFDRKNIENTMESTHPKV
jgi:hypothetical protein